MWCDPILTSVSAFVFSDKKIIYIFCRVSSGFFGLPHYHRPILGLYVFVGKIPAATVEDVDLAVQAAKAAFSRNNGELWARATGKVRAGYLRAIAAKVNQSNFVPGPRILASSFYHGHNCVAISIFYISNCNSIWLISRASCETHSRLEHRDVH